MRLHPTTVVLAATGLAATAALAAAAMQVHDDTEDDLLEQRAREAGAVLTASLPGIETPLAAAVELVEVTEAGDAGAFELAMGRFVGEDGPFVSVSAWPLDGGATGPALVVGDEPALASRSPEEIRAFLDQAATSSTLTVVGLLDEAQPRLGYAVTAPQPPVSHLVYAEGALPEDRTRVRQPDTAFGDLDYALYLGGTEREEDLLIASTSSLPLDGRRASEEVAFGDTSLLLVVTPTGNLGGSLLAALPWIVLVVGAAMTASSALLTERLLRRRDQAEHLARDNARLYDEQRAVAQSLQHSLLPRRLPDLEGIELAVRYQPGVEGLEIGGDWYDVVPTPGGGVAIVIGDVSGRGVNAASVMASVRFASRALARQGDAPEVVLTKLNASDDPDRDGHFVTMLCGHVDLAAGTATFANAGHPPPLLVADGAAAFVGTATGPPIGVRPGRRYDARTSSLPAGGTLVLFTDGLFERRDESVDVGLERLRSIAAEQRGSLEELVDALVRRLAHGGGEDDAAVLAVRWGAGAGNPGAAGRAHP